MWGKNGRVFPVASWIVLLLTACGGVLLAGHVGEAEQGSRADALVSRVMSAALVVSRIRELPVREPLCVRPATPSMMRELIRDRVRREYSSEEIGAEGRMLGLLGLVDRPESYESQVLDALAGDVTGFYDPDGRCLFLTEDASFEDDVSTIYHEVAHALQDQTFDLRSLRRHVAGESDREAAIAAVTEGDATAVSIAATEDRPWTSLRWPREIRRGLPRGHRRPGDPLAAHLEHTLRFTYADGLALVQRRYRAGGWNAVNELLRSPPRSTEEVLRLGSDGADLTPDRVRVSRPGALESSCRLAHEDTLGRVVLESAMTRWATPEDARTATTGWGGDRALLYENCPVVGLRMLLVATVWRGVESTGTASGGRFARGMARALERRHRGPARPTRNGVAVRSVDGRCSVVAHEGRVVIYLEGASCDAGEEIAYAVLRELEPPTPPAGS